MAAFDHLNKIEIYKQAAGEEWNYLMKTQSKVNKNCCHRRWYTPTHITTAAGKSQQFGVKSNLSLSIERGPPAIESNNS